MAQTKRHIAVIDEETYGFKAGRDPKPFACGFYDGERFIHTWGMDCIEQMLAILDKLPHQYQIFAHNGGKFDFHHMVKYARGSVFCINGRLARMTIGRHTFQDSLLIYPMALKNHKKTKIDYRKFEPNKFQRHRAEIVDYLRDDCVSLYELVSAFQEEFGNRMTIGGTAMRSLREMHPFSKINEHGDKIMRPFYFGGRVECYQAGEIEGPWHVYDVNSMYPHVMRSRRHPVNGRYRIGNRLPSGNSPYFAVIEGRNYGALPTRAEGGCSFQSEYGEPMEGFGSKPVFAACSHEIETALDLGLLRIDKVLKCYTAVEHTDFSAYIDHWYERRLQAKRDRNDLMDQFCKLMMNSAYGKFAQDPSKFKQNIITDSDASTYIRHLEAGWSPIMEADDYTLWERDAGYSFKSYFDVAISASITSAARSVLLRALTKAVDPIYTDTDSIICRSLDADIDKSRLGAWKLEETAEHAAIAGKKLYVLWNGETRNAEVVKLAAKGVGLIKDKEDVKGIRRSMATIRKIANGGEVEITKQAPTYRVKVDHRKADPGQLFITRKVVNTAMRV